MAIIRNKYVISEIITYISNDDWDHVATFRQLGRSYKELVDNKKLLRNKKREAEYSILVDHINVGIDFRILKIFASITVIEVKEIEQFELVCEIEKYGVLINVESLCCDLENDRNKQLVHEFISLGGYIRNLYNTPNNRAVGELIDFRDLPATYIDLRRGNNTGFIAVNLNEPILGNCNNIRNCPKYKMHYSNGRYEIYKRNSVTGKLIYLTEF